MTPQTLARMSALLDEALDLDAPARAAWLEGLQGDDRALSGTLRKLLGNEVPPNVGELLQAGPQLTSLGVPRPTPAVTPALAEGHRIGPYRLLRSLGVGGMGEVWLAERADGALRRQVALKLPNLGVKQAVLLQRFARERDILAALEHPHIARLYDAGVADDGQPYLALEYVEGLPIDEWCREAAAPVPERVRLLTQVAEAVAFAHSRLVLHRDLKPANILVNAQGQVRLLDFGIAKLMEGDSTDETELTQLGGRALTPRYASPEQLRGEALATASDVYSLGVVAYELLAGVSPYGDELRTPVALERAIAEDRVPPPSASCSDPKLCAQLRGDLDAIVAHAMRARPADRYRSAEALAADLRRHLQGQQVQARTERWWHRGRRLALRHRLPLALAGTALAALAAALGLGATILVTLALAAGLAGALWQARRARAQAQRAQTEARTAKAVKTFLLDVFRVSSGDQADPERARERTALELLGEGADRIERELEDAPEAKVELLHTLAEMCVDLGDVRRALRLRESAVRTAERSFGPRSERLAEALARLAMSLAEEGRRQQALPLLQRAESVISLQRQPDHALRLTLDIAWAEHYRWAQDPAGLPFAERAVALALKQPPDNAWLNALVLLGVMQRLAGRLQDSLASFERAASLAPRVPGGAASVLAAVHQEAATAALALGDAARCEHHLRATLEIDLRIGGEGTVYAAMDRRELGLFLAGQGREDDARAQFGMARAHLDATRESVREEGTRRALCCHEGGVERLLCDPVRSLALLDEAVALESDPAEVPTTATLQRFLRCDALLDLGRVDEAAAAWREGAALRSRFELSSPGWRLQEALREVRVVLARGDALGAASRGRAALEAPGAREAKERDVLVELVIAIGRAEAAAGHREAADAAADEASHLIATPPRPRMIVPLRRLVRELQQAVR